MNKTDWLFMWGIIGVLTVIPQTFAIYGIRTGNENMASAFQVLSMFWIMIVSCTVIIYATQTKDESEGV